MDGDGDIDAEDKTVCALDGRGDDVCVGPLETFDALRVETKREKDVGAVLKPSFVYVLPYIGIDGDDMPR